MGVKIKYSLCITLLHVKILPTTQIRDSPLHDLLTLVTGRIIFMKIHIFLMGILNMRYLKIHENTERNL